MLSINPSETIWTILCFLALLFVLDRLLYRPLVRFMDARKARIDAGLNEEREAQAALDEEARGLAQERQERLREAGEELRADKGRSEEHRAEAVREAKKAASDAAEQAESEAEALRGKTSRELDLRRDELAETLKRRLLEAGNTEQ
jgi:F-type H+-transporting ATPase subunit b